MDSTGAKQNNPGGVLTNTLNDAATSYANVAAHASSTLGAVARARVLIKTRSLSLSPTIDQRPASKTELSVERGRRNLTVSVGYSNKSTGSSTHLISSIY